METVITTIMAVENKRPPAGLLAAAVGLRIRALIAQQASSYMSGIVRVARVFLHFAARARNRPHRISLQMSSRLSTCAHRRLDRGLCCAGWLYLIKLHLQSLHARGERPRSSFISSCRHRDYGGAARRASYLASTVHRKCQQRRLLSLLS